MAMTLITTNPDSTDVASVSFTSSIDSTYKLYIFKFYDINPATDRVTFATQFSTDGGSNYGMAVTTTTFYAVNEEADGGSELAYEAGQDIGGATGTGDITLVHDLGSDSDQSAAGELYLFNPSNTTYVKHFYTTFNQAQYADNSKSRFTSGFINSTSDVDAIIFRMSSGNMDGVIKMYGVK